MNAARDNVSAPFLAQVASSFGKACDSYLPAARLQQQVALDALALLPPDRHGHLVDLGCGPGWIHPQLSLYSQQVSAIDLSAGMLAKAAQQQLARRYIQADAAALPLADASADKLFSSLMLQWCARPEAVFAEVSRVLAGTGKFAITTLVQGTLQQLREAFASVDNQPHVNQFLPADAVIAAAQSVRDISWQFEQRSYILYYADVQSLARELKALGANQVAGRQSRGLAGKGYWQRIATAYESERCELGLPATYQVLIITGTKHER